MRKVLLLRFFVLSLLFLVSVVVKPQTVEDDGIVFSEKYSENKNLNNVVIGEDCGLKNGTITFDLYKNKNNSTPEYLKSKSAVLLSQGNSITFTGTNSNITQIEIEYTSSVNSVGADRMILSSGEYSLLNTGNVSKGVWTGNDRTIVLSISRNTSDMSNKLIKSIKISYGLLKSDACLSFGSQTSYSIFENEKFVLPTVVTDAGYTGELSYYSSDNDVAVVGVDGTVEVKGQGSTTITAVGTATDTHNGGRCSIDLNVKRIPPSGAFLYESFDNYNGEGGHDGLWSGTLYNIGDVSVDGWTFKNGLCAYKCLLLGTSSSKGTATTPSVKVEANKSYILKFKAAAWNSANESTILNISSTPRNILQQSTVNLDKAKFTDYSILLNNSASDAITITFSANKDASSRFFLDEVQLIDPNIRVSSARYTVYVTPMAVDFTKTPAISAYKVTEVNPSGVVLTKVTKVPAKTPLVIEADAGTYRLEEADDADVEKITDNALFPANGEVCGDGSTIYSLANISGVGFYRVAAGIKIPIGKAYISVSSQHAKDYMPFIGEATGIQSAVCQDKSAGALYNLQGIKVKNHSKGIYIRNGKKIIF